MNKVVITGIGMLTPLGLDTKTSWESLLNGVSGISKPPSEDSATDIPGIAGIIKGFDPETILERKKAAHMDRVSQLACHAAVEAVKDAGLNFDKMSDPYRTAVIVGSGIGGLHAFTETFGIIYTPNTDFRKQMRKLTPYTVPMLTIDSVSANISIMYGLKGPAIGITSACATGGDSLAQAAMMIQSGQMDVVLSGGSEAPIEPVAFGAFNACRALSTRIDSPKTASRPFDKTRDGFVMSEGACVLILESEKFAKKRGAKIICELAGYAGTSDAYHSTRPEPSARGAIEAMQRALKSANIAPDEVDYINAHGTSTYWNDLCETKAIKAVFGGNANRIPISATKSMTGHMIGAAGAVEAAVCALSIRDQKIHPTINLHEPDPECDLDYTANKALQHKTDVALSNSFGFGGHNVCIVLKSNS